MISLYLETTDSTNAFARRHYAKFSQEKITLIHASYQTSGLGTNQRHWHSEKGENILATYCFAKSPKILPHQYTQTLAIAARRMLSHFHIDASIKWPNDLLVGNKKIAGIKAEGLGDALFATGIGLNVNLLDISKIDQNATSIFLEIGHSTNIQEALDILSQEYLALLKELHTFGFSAILPFYKEAIELYDNRLVTSSEMGEGYLRGVTKEGYLLLEGLDKRARIIQAGSIIPKQLEESVFPQCQSPEV